MSFFKSWMIVLLICGITLAGCGFSPVFQSRGSEEQYHALTTMLASIDVPFIRGGRSGQQVYAALKKSLNPQGIDVHQDYRLTVQISETESALGFQITGFPTRYKLEISARYQLTDLKKQTIIDHGTLKMDAPYDVAPSQYATYVSRDASIEHVTHEIGHLFKQRMVAVFLRDHDKAAHKRH